MILFEKSVRLSQLEYVCRWLSKPALKFLLKSRMKQSVMESYRLSENAKLDLKRIYIRGLHLYDEIQADRYFNEFFERFEQIAEQPLLYPTVDEIRSGTLDIM